MRRSPAASGRTSACCRAQAPDGSLEYFVDEAPNAPTLYESDFVLTDIDGPSEVGPLAGIDHVCLALPADALDTWILFFKTAFGFEAERSWLVPDPYGLMRSRAVRSADGSVRIALNASVDRHTAVAESLDRYHGTGLNHVAFRTDDIVKTIAAFAADGIPFLRIPPNYYDDLAARYALPDDLIETLSTHHLLYDRDEHGGEFLHAIRTGRQPLLARNRRAARRIRRLRRDECGRATRRTGAAQEVTEGSRLGFKGRITFAARGCFKGPHHARTIAVNRSAAPRPRGSPRSGRKPHSIWRYIP